MKEVEEIPFSNIFTTKGYDGIECYHPLMGKEKCIHAYDLKKLTEDEHEIIYEVVIDQEIKPDKEIIERWKKGLEKNKYKIQKITDTSNKERHWIGAKWVISQSKNPKAI